MSDVYEQQKTLNEYMTCSYGDHLPLPPPLSSLSSVSPPLSPFQDLSVPFQKRVADLCLHYQASLNTKGERALDIGCGVGRSTFELRRGYSDVIGIEYSKKFVEICDILQRDGVFHYFVPVEGHITLPATATVPPHQSSAKFQHGDACSLPDDLGSFDLVLGANLIDRLHDPLAFLRRLPSLVNSEGILVLTSPYTWMDCFTPVERWIGGKKEGEEEKKTLEELKRILGADFELVDVMDVPMTIREHSRKYQLCVPQASVWRRK